jgi:hypothetical protein
VDGQDTPGHDNKETNLLRPSPHAAACLRADMTITPVPAPCTVQK